MLAFFVLTYSRWDLSNMEKTSCTLTLISLLSLVGCQRAVEDEVIENGSNVIMHYTLEAEGQLVASSAGKDPLDYTAGNGPFPGLDEKILGLKAGDKKEVTVNPTEGHGLHDATLVQKIPRSRFGEQELKVGGLVEVEAFGRNYRRRVVEVGDTDVTLDLNHPLAGKPMNFSVEIVSVRSNSSRKLRAMWKYLEVTAVSIAVLLLLLLLASNWTPRLRTSTYAPLTIFLVGCGVLAAYGSFFIGGKERSSLDEAMNRPVAEISPEAKYVGSKTCHACHPHEHATWHASYHRTMTQVATPENVVAPFAGEVLRSPSETFKLERVADTFWADFDKTTLTKKEHVRRQIVLTTGSHHEQDYWYATEDGRTLGRLPFVWRIPEQRWIPDHAVFITPPGDARPFGKWNVNCIKCHVTQGQPRPVLSLELFDTKVAEFGISCEACHGPGRAHIKRHANVIQRYQQHMSVDADESIILPSRLSPQKQSQVCGQCHSVFGFNKPSDVNEWLKRGFAYRAGEDLHEARFVHRGGPESDHPNTQKTLERIPRYLEDRFWSDGMVRISGREYNGLIESPCYQHGDESRGVLSCLTCHQMHVAAEDPRPLAEWTNDQLGPEMETNHACVQCHKQFNDQEILTAHTHHLANSTGSRCYNCHMPHTTWGLLKSIRSHEIDYPLVQDTLKTGRPTACNLCHLDQTLAWTDETLSRWYGHPISSLSEDQQTISASILSMLTGDAGQRSIVAWHTRWAPAQEISGKYWMAPYLSHLLSDPYPAVRFTAHESLKSLPGFAEFNFDFVGPIRERELASGEAREQWNRAFRPGPGQANLLLDDLGKLDWGTFERLSRQRDDRRVDLAE